ncbi:MAG TPA: sugar ABC transporter ATP-binding protein [Lachnospiraceae bacterium]|jgi:multiple sugar transport system permease protein|nr:sugar ABC transporter ATP-binding protein [Lachnospiraceae bacterium]
MEQISIHNNKIMNTISKKKGLMHYIRLSILYILLIIGAAIFLIPFIWMLSASLKESKDVFTYPLQWIPEHFVWENYKVIWEKVRLLQYFANTAKITIIITCIQIFTSSFAAYAFAKMEFKGRNTLFLLYVGTIAIPWQAYMIPQYILMGKLGLVNTHIGYILLQSFSAFGVFLIRQFYIGIPNELLEAARIDGLSEYGIYFKLMLPLSKPAIATLCISSFVFIWNDFMGPLIYFSSDSLKTLQIGLRFFITENSADYNYIMAASVVSLIPVIILFVFLQKYFVQGIATSGLKA